MERAYAVLDVKAADAPSRKISGVATTPTADRMGDVLEPLGATFTNPIPLLWHHDKERPIGRAYLHPATVDGIRFDAEIPTITDAGPLRDRTDEAWQCLKAGLIRAVSVGYRARPGGVKHLPSGGRHFTRTEICELSLVTIPANVDATIHAIKSIDAQYLAASGPNPSGAPDHSRISTMTTAEQITQFENTRAAKVARMGAIMATATDATLPDAARDEYDALSLDVKSIDDHLVRARELEKLQQAAATRVDPTTTPRNPIRTTTPVVSVKSNAPEGLTYVRSVMSLLYAKGDSFRALERAKQYADPNVELLIKAAVAPGTTTDPAWAAPLVTVSNLTKEFIALSRAASILGRVPGLRHVPFNTAVPIVTAGGTYKWVGQAKAKPVGKMQFGSSSLAMAKAAGIIVLTEELARSSSPSAEMIVRDEMVAGIAAFLDQQFIDPAVAAVADLNPASITNGAPTAASTDKPDSDLGLIVGHFASVGLPLAGLTVIMSEANAYAMGAARNGLGQSNFPGVGATGGSASGITIVGSNAAGSNVIGVAPGYVLLADDGGVSIDVSREATVQMNDAPVNPTDPATTVWTSFFQDNLIGLRAERFINWKKASAQACYYLTGAQYTV